MVGPRATSPKERWEGDSGVTLGDRLAREYRDGASQSTLIEKYHVEWTKLQAIIQSHGIHIRGKSQQAFIQKFGRDPEIISRLTGPKLHLIFAMFGDGLRPTSQTRRNTHIIGIAAGKDRDFAEYWISSVDIWNDLHRYATFGTRSWKFNEAAMRHLMGDRALLAPIGYGVRGLFDADGSVKYEVKRASRQVTIASVNRVGLAQVSMLLTHIGQGHRLYEDCIAIFGRRNLVDFQSKIGFGIRRKNEALIRMVSSFRIKLEKGGL